MIGFRPTITDFDRYVADITLSDPQLVAGKVTPAFEAAFASHLGVKHAIAVNSCTSGLHLVYLAYKVLNGIDEIEVPAMTHVATGFAAEYAGLRPQWIDESVWSGKWTDKALNVETKPETSAGVYSFFPTKNLTCLEGGMIATDSDAIAEFCRHRRAFGYVKEGYGYDVPDLAFNYRMNEVEAAIGLSQLQRLPETQAKRRENAKILLELDESEMIGDAYCVNVYRDDRDWWITKLRHSGVQPSIHYPRPVPLMSYFGYPEGSFPKSERIAKRAISLPIGPHLGSDDMETILKALK